MRTVFLTSATLDVRFRAKNTDTVRSVFVDVEDRRVVLDVGETAELAVAGRYVRVTTSGAVVIEPLGDTREG